MARSPFITHLQRSRRVKSPQWSAKLSAATPVPAAAWITGGRKVKRVATTHRHLVKLAQAPSTPLKPSAVLFVEKAKVFKIERRAQLRKLLPLGLFPPPTGPPVPYPAWAAVRSLSTFQDRRLLKAPDAPVYPQTSVTVSPDRALSVSFVTTQARSRKLQRPPDHASYPAPAAPGTPQGYPAWLAKRAQVTTQKRKALKAPGAPVYPATPAAPAQPFAAVTANRVKRRKSRQGLFLSSGGVTEARVQPQLPSYAAPIQLRRSETKRTLQRLAHSASYPATPVPTQPEVAWRAIKAKRSDYRRKLVHADAQLSFPPTPPVPSQPESSWRLRKATQAGQKRRLIPAAAQPSFPATKVSNVEAVLIRALRRRVTERKPLWAGHGPSYPQAPVALQPFSAWRAVQAFKRPGRYVLRPVLELDERPWVQPALPTTFIKARVRRRSLQIERGKRGLTFKPEGNNG